MAVPAGFIMPNQDALFSMSVNQYINTYKRIEIPVHKNSHVGVACILEIIQKLCAANPPRMNIIPIKVDVSIFFFMPIPSSDSLKSRDMSIPLIVKA